MNHLSGEVSPYLIAHAKQPVDWYPWGAEAFEKAKKENKPVFLSVGYSTCHWCHVMSGESFENEDVARVLNDSFISVKVDREERPDVDAVYIAVCQALNGSAGWPMTVIMTPEQQPFFAASYLPRETRGNYMGLLPLLKIVAHKWKNEPESLIRTGADITAHLRKTEPAGNRAEPKKLMLDAYEQLAASYDDEYGGFGRAPKFPTVPEQLFLLRWAYFSGDRDARNPVEHTLRQMFRGGIFDHFGGGFSRYSTDREWLVPHFEKTLYDNALLAYVYTEAWQDGHFQLYRDAAERTLDYCIRELRSDDGGFFCGQDADSDGVEGAYYLFTPEEIQSVLGADDGRHFAECYDITKEGNFEGKSIPNLLLNDKFNMLPPGYAAFCEKLREYRKTRHTLDTDTKILTSWNGLMLMALSKSAKAYGRDDYLAAAQSLAQFLRFDGELRAVRAGGRSYGTADLADYAFYALGLVELYDVDFDAKHLILAQELGENILTRFEAPDGGYYSTPEDGEKLISRPREQFDGAIPADSGAALMLFTKLWRLTANTKWRDAAQALSDYICSHANRYPAGAAFALCAMMETEYPTRELVCVCPTEAIPDALKAVTARYAPELAVLVKTPANAERLADAAPFTAEYTAKNGKAAFYVCSGGACQLPVEM